MDPRIVIGLGFGDEGKGMAVAHEVERAVGCGLRPVVVRFNGGPQAQHNVRVLRDGRVLHHTHSQIGSGAMLGARTVVTDGVLFDPLTFVEEARHLSRIMGRDMAGNVTVDLGCPLVTPLHVFANRELETARGDGRHGSTGHGVGIARECDRASTEGRSYHEMRMTVRDIYTSHYGVGGIVRKLFYWRSCIDMMFRTSLCKSIPDDELWAWAKRMVDAVESIGPATFGLSPFSKYAARDDVALVFEGSQGMLLDKRVGWFPHVTYGDMDAFEARRLCGDAKARVIGVTRSYQTRHGAGPMPTEGTCDIAESDNETYEWAGAFRTGLLDVPNLARAAAATCADEIAVSHMDRYPGAYVATWHDRGNVAGIDRDVPRDPFVVKSGEEKLVRRIEDACHAPVTVVGRGPTTDCWQDRK